MPDTETTAEWAKRDPQHSLIECADRLQDQGHSIDALADAMMAITLTMQTELHGPRAVAQRLWLLAQKYAGEADAADRAEWGADAAIN
jgi:hypothetical protein